MSSAFALASELCVCVCRTVYYLKEEQISIFRQKVLLAISISEENWKSLPHIALVMEGAWTPPCCPSRRATKHPCFCSWELVQSPSPGQALPRARHGRPGAKGTDTHTSLGTSWFRLTSPFPLQQPRPKDKQPSLDLWSCRRDRGEEASRPGSVCRGSPQLSPPV